jgi:hypothetical protein
MSPAEPRVMWPGDIIGWLQRQGIRAGMLTLNERGTRLPCVRCADEAAENVLRQVIGANRVGLEAVMVVPGYWTVLPREAVEAVASMQPVKARITAA